MDFSPFGPTVNSVARMVRPEQFCVEPSGRTTVAQVPGGNRTVAERDPALSLFTVLFATCKGEAVPKLTTVAMGSALTSITSSRQRKSCTGASICLWAGQYP